MDTVCWGMVTEAALSVPRSLLSTQPQFSHTDRILPRPWRAVGPSTRPLSLGTPEPPTNPGRFNRSGIPQPAFCRSRALGYRDGPSARLGLGIVVPLAATRRSQEHGRVDRRRPYGYSHALDSLALSDEGLDVQGPCVESHSATVVILQPHDLPGPPVRVQA
jgi:hypothetical protein